ncbi:MAG: S1 RNA-binding domain-containing protein [Planctomycetota bacterium]|jgi:ribosomal protein S1
MVDRNLITKLGLSNEQIEQEVNELFTSEHTLLLEEELAKNVESLTPGSIVSGRIVTQLGNDVIVELGLKSEGMVEASEFDDPSEIVPGKEIEVLLEEMDAQSGILLSKRKADRIRGWERVIESNAEGDVVKGIVSRRIKGGLLVDIGLRRLISASRVTSVASSVRKSNVRSSRSIRKTTTSWCPVVRSSKKNDTPVKKRSLLRSKKARFAKVSSRTSPTLASSWTLAA